MKVFAAICAFASLASAVSVDLTKRETPLKVQFEVVGNTEVKADITNTGATALKLVKSGSFLDDTAVEKVEVFQDGSKIAFDGVRLRILTKGLPEEAFQVIAPGETVSKTFDVAQVHDLSAGGTFDFASQGAFAAADADSSDITTLIPFSANKITTEVDGAAAAETRTNFLAKRTTIQSDCTGARLTTLRTAIGNCRSLATAASSAAGSNTAKLNEYFKSTTSSARSTVQGVFSRSATDCATSGGYSRSYCTDVYGGVCNGGVIAYTLPSGSYIAYCQIFFNNLPALTKTCHAQDQATTVLHESTHLTQVKGTDDYGGYGYNFVRSLSSAQNLNHADTYSLFANAIYAGC